MLAPAMAGQEARTLLDKTLKEGSPHLELDRDVFEQALGPRPDQYSVAFKTFCESGILPQEVVSFCQDKLWRNRL